jgi:tetratricopeptide (TPR) repeat protein
MLRFFLAAAVLCLLGVAPVQAQVIRVAGTVKDDAGRPIRGAAITAENPDQTPPRLTTTSNDKGQFGFIGVRRGAWTISVAASGFEPLRFVRQVSSGRQDTMDVRLARTSAPVDLALDGIKASDIQQRIDRADSLASSGDIDGAILAWRDVLARVPALTSVFMQIGALYERKPDRDRALETYRQLLAIEPGHVAASAAIERLGREF